MGDLADHTTARGRLRNAIWLTSLPDRPEVIEIRKDAALMAADEALAEAWDEAVQAAADAVWANPRRPRWGWVTPTNPYRANEKEAGDE